MAYSERELLTPADAAKIVGLSPQGIKLAGKDGRLPVAACTPRGMMLFERRDVEAFVEARRAVA